MQSSGVLPSQALLSLAAKGAIICKQPSSIVQPNSIDLPLGSKCWRLRSIRLPRSIETVLDVVKELAIDELDLEHGCILERNAVYIAELDISFSLTSDLRGECDSKSSTGRIDVQTRVLTDNNERYDFIAPGYKGKAYVFISSNSFLVRVSRGICLNQARLVRGEPVLGDDEAHTLVAEEKLLYVDGNPLSKQHIIVSGGVLMRLDLKQPIVGYRAKRTNAVVDLRKLDNPIDEFWETIHGGTESITLERNEFYILSTLEHIRVPHTHTAWIPPFRPEFGEFRSHYAGFYDAGFGYGDGTLKGATTTLEVRSQDNSLTLLHGTPVAPVLFMKLSEDATIIYGAGKRNNYQSQSGPKLAKYFN